MTLVFLIHGKPSAIRYRYYSARIRFMQPSMSAEGTSPQGDNGLCNDGSPLRVLIYGGCVSRDPFSEAQEYQLKLVDYIARSSLISSISSKPYPYKESDLSTISSSFQRRMVGWDLGSTYLKQQVVSGKYDVLLMDFMVERLSVVEPSPGVFITKSPEFAKSRIRLPKCPVISPWTRERFDYWCQAWKDFTRLLSDAGVMPKLRINQVYWSTLLPDGTHYTGWGNVDHINAELRRMYDRAQQDIPKEQFYEFTQQELAIDTNHQWGLSPFHFGQQYHEALLSKLNRENTNQA